MATKVYIPSGASWDASGSTVDNNNAYSAWTSVSQGGVLKPRYGWANITNIALADGGHSASQPGTANVTATVSSGAAGGATPQNNVQLVVYLGPLAVGQTISASQAWSMGIMQNDSTFTNIFTFAGVIKVMSSAGTVRKTIAALTTDTVVNGVTLTSRFISGTGSTGTYVTVANDYLVGEFGCKRDFLDSTSYLMREGDGNASDIDTTDSTTARNGFFQIADTLTIQSSGVPNQLMMTGVGL